jgi:hypothetical protein
MKKLSNKQRVYNLFKFSKVLYFSDISYILDIDLKEVVEICKELVSERKIRVHKEKK